MPPRLSTSLALLLVTLSACAGSTPPAAENQSLAAPDDGGECYCNVRKRQQVEKRLQQKEQSDQD